MNGKDAALKGYLLNSNPHKYGSEEYLSWLDQYEDGLQKLYIASRKALEERVASALFIESAAGFDAGMSGSRPLSQDEALDATKLLLAAVEQSSFPTEA